MSDGVRKGVQGEGNDGDEERGGDVQYLWDERSNDDPESRKMDPECSKEVERDRKMIEMWKRLVRKGLAEIRRRIKIAGKMTVGPESRKDCPKRITRKTGWSGKIGSGNGRRTRTFQE